MPFHHFVKMDSVVFNLSFLGGSDLRVIRESVQQVEEVVSNTARTTYGWLHQIDDCEAI